MAAASWRQRLREEVTCSVCLDLFADPLSLGCGHSFCRACLAQSWRESPAGGAACPRCGEAAQESACKANALLASFADVARQLSAQAGRAGGEGLCERHLEPLKLFCEDDGALLCLVCEKSRLHRDHSMVPLEEAAQEYQERICVCLENLRKRRETILVYQSNTEMESEELLKLTERERQKTVTEFRELHQLLEAEENRLLAQMEAADEEIMKKRDEHMARFSEELSSLDGIIQELEDKCQRMARELLEDGGSIFRRCEQKEKAEVRGAFPSGLKWRVWDFCDIHSILRDAMTNFKANLKAEHLQRKANVFAKRRLFHHFRKLLKVRPDEHPSPASSTSISARKELLGGRATHESSMLGSVPPSSAPVLSFEGVGQNGTPV